MNNDRYIMYTLGEVRRLMAEMRSLRQHVKAVAQRRRLLLLRLVEHGIPKTRLAREIGVSRNTLYRILEGTDRDS